MCGIAGVISRSGRAFNPRKIKDMCDVLAHRGPDDAGYVFFRQGQRITGEGEYWCSFVDPKFRHLNEHLPALDSDYYCNEVSQHPITVGLGHRRLSIIDLTHYGHQPMCSSDRRYWVVFNGEIYNYLEIREELSSRGHIFRTRTDTEVLLHLWEEYGADSISKLNGMFAFALYDRVDNIMILARDRFGVKPLYYALTEDFVIFGSETKAILASGLLSAEIDPDALAEYFAFQNIFSERTLFNSIRILPAGCMLQVTPTSDKSLKARKYDAGFPALNIDMDHSGDELSRDIVRTFEASVTRQLMSDVPVGAYLSGGMDSGSIVAIAGRTIPRLLTFTAGFDLTNVNGIEQGFDERGLSEKLAHYLQTEHYEVVLHAGDMPAIMERLTWHVDDPRVGMCHQNWYAAKLASRFVKVCLSGAGGDELFGGYPWRYRHGLDSTDVLGFDDSYFNYWNRLVEPSKLSELFSSDIQSNIPIARQAFQAVMDDLPQYNPEYSRETNFLHRALCFEFKTFLHGLLIIEDRVSMAHSLEVRVPFLDNQLADLAMRISPQLKVKGTALNYNQSHIQTAEGKKILRQAMTKILPEEYTQQKKQGFSPPDENWYRGPSMDYIKEILLDDRALDRPWFNRAFVEQCLQEHFSGAQNNRLLIWSLLSFEWLQRHFVDK